MMASNWQDHANCKIKLKLVKLFGIDVRLSNVLICDIWMIL